MLTVEEKMQTMQPKHPQPPVQTDAKPEDAKKTTGATFRFADWASI